MNKEPNPQPLPYEGRGVRAISEFPPFRSGRGSKGVSSWAFGTYAGRPAIACDDGRGIRAALYTVVNDARLYQTVGGTPAWVLAEWVEYRLRVEGADDWTVTVNGRQAKRDPDGYAVIIYQNALGLSTIKLRATQRSGDGRNTTRDLPPLEIEVMSLRLDGLIGAGQSYPAFVARLVADIGAAVRDFSREMDTGGLPFAFVGATAYPVVAADTADVTALAPDSRLFFYHFLLRYSPAMLEAAAIVLHAPYHRRVVRAEMRPAADVSEIDADVLLDVLRNRGVETAPTASYIQQIGDETPDTPENRFVLAFLRDTRRKARALAVWLAGESAVWASEAARHITDISGALDDVLGDPFWRGISAHEQADPEEYVQYPSQALQKRAGYADLFGLWQTATSVAHPRFFRRLDRAIAARDVATLYEYWAFFDLARRLNRMLDTPGTLTTHNTETGSLGYDSAITFGSYALVYNHTFRARAGRAASYSRPFRPDFALLRNHAPLLVFDAKLRGRIGDFVTGSAEATSDDLAKMHAYRDALGVQAALALYPAPQSDSQFYDEDRHQTFAPGDADMILAAVLAGERQGVGALGALP